MGLSGQCIVITIWDVAFVKRDDEYHVLMNEEEDLTPELLEGGVNALRRNSVRRRLEQVQRDIVEASRRDDAARVAELTAEKLRLKRLLGAAKMASDVDAAD